MLNLTVSCVVRILVLIAAGECQSFVDENEIKKPGESKARPALALIEALVGDDLEKKFDAQHQIKFLENHDAELSSELLQHLKCKSNLTVESRCALIDVLPYVCETEQATDVAIIQLSMSSGIVRHKAASVLRQLTNSTLSERHAGLLVDAWMLEPDDDIRENIADALARRFDEYGHPWKDDREGKEQGSILSLHPSARSWAVNSVEKLAERVTNPSEFVSSWPVDLVVYRKFLPTQNAKSKLGRSGPIRKENEPIVTVRLRLQQMVRYRAAWFLAVLGEDASLAVPGLLSTLVDESEITIQLHPDPLTRYRGTKVIRMDDALAEVLGYISPNRSFETVEEFLAYKKRRKIQIADAEQRSRLNRDEYWKENEELQKTFTDRLRESLTNAESDEERITSIQEFGKPAFASPLRRRGPPWHEFGEDSPAMSKSEREAAQLLFEEAVKGGEVGSEAKTALVVWIRHRRVKENDIYVAFRDQPSSLTPRVSNYFEQTTSKEEESLKKYLLEEARAEAKSRGESTDTEKAEALRKLLEERRK